MLATIKTLGHRALTAAVVALLAAISASAQVPLPSTNSLFIQSSAKAIVFPQGTWDPAAVGATDPKAVNEPPVKPIFDTGSAYGKYDPSVGPDGTIMLYMREIAFLRGGCLETLYASTTLPCEEYPRLYFEGFVTAILVHEYYHALGVPGGNVFSNPGHVAIYYTLTEKLCAEVGELIDDVGEGNPQQTNCLYLAHASGYCDYLKYIRLRASRDVDIQNNANAAQNYTEPDDWPDDVRYPPASPDPDGYSLDNNFLTPCDSCDGLGC